MPADQSELRRPALGGAADDFALVAKSDQAVMSPLIGKLANAAEDIAVIVRGAV